MAADPMRAERGDPYSGTALLAAGVATFFFPVISLIAALLLLSAEQRPSRRASLRTWAWVSVGWIALQVLAVILFLMAFSFDSASTTGQGA
jgi:hypothetical protein